MHLSVLSALVVNRTNMKKEKHLFELIKSLDKNEKRYFKLTASLQSGEKNYLTLFDTIAKQEDYSEKLVKNELQDRAFIKHLPFKKNHLYRLLLKSLRNYHHQISINSFLQDALRNVEILYSKGLYDHCKNVIKKSKVLALQYEKFLSVIDLNIWMRRIIQLTLDSKEIKEQLAAIHDEDLKLVKIVENLNEYRRLSDEMYFVISARRGVRSNQELDEVKKVAAHQLMKGESAALCTEAKTHFNFIKGEIAYQLKDLKGNYRHRYRILEIIEAEPELINENVLRYINSLHNFCIACKALHKKDEIFDTLKKIRELPQKFPGKFSEELKSKTLMRVFNFELDYYLETAEVPPHVADVERSIEQMNLKIDPLQRKILFYKLALIYFNAGHYPKAVTWLNKIINDNKLDVSADIDCYSRILNIITQYEMGNTDLMEYLIKSTQRFLQKLNRFYKFEKILLHFVSKKLLRASDKKQELQYFKDLKPELEKLVKDPFEGKAFNYFNFMLWIESKIQNKPFGELLRKG